MGGRMKELVTRLHRRQDGFTLVELLVVVAIVVALAAVSTVGVTQFAGKGEEGARSAELASVQVSMDTMMASKTLASVTSHDSTLSTGIDDFSANPVEGALTAYLRDNPATYFYCWDGTGKVVQLLTSTDTCPASPY